MIALILVITAFAICTLRLILGPTAPDRVIAVDALGTLMIVILVLLGIQYEQTMLLDVAIAYSILAFIGTIAISKYLEGDKLYR